MPRTLEKLNAKVKREYLEHGPNCLIIDVVIKSLTDFLSVFGSVLGKSDELFWFRGHSDYNWSLKPSALRFNKPSDRDNALNLIDKFKLYAEMRLGRPPDPNEELKWVQLAQHYGLPTRLLDWTENAAISLYFACLDPKTNGCVFLINPVDLNRAVDPKRPRVFDVNRDLSLINEYLLLTGERDPKNGLNTIAIHPSWNSERIMLQRGTFTLHGSKIFSLTKEQAPSLVYVPILKEYKNFLLNELERIGISEMSIFPELEHVCNYLKRNM